MQVKRLRELLDIDGRLVLNNYENRYMQIGTGDHLTLIFIHADGRIENPRVCVERLPRSLELEADRIYRELLKMDYELLRYEIMKGRDEFENPITMYRCFGNSVVETQVEEVVWGGNDADGYLIHQDTHFETYKEALERAVTNAKVELEHKTNAIEQQKNMLAELIDAKETDESTLADLMKQLEKEHDN